MWPNLRLQKRKPFWGSCEPLLRKGYAAPNFRSESKRNIIVCVLRSLGDGGSDWHNTSSEKRAFRRVMPWMPRY